jgi:hypothetical protein
LSSRFLSEAYVVAEPATAVLPYARYRG